MQNKKNPRRILAAISLLSLSVSNLIADKIDLHKTHANNTSDMKNVNFTATKVKLDAIKQQLKNFSQTQKELIVTYKSKKQGSKLTSRNKINNLTRQNEINKPPTRNFNSNKKGSKLTREPPAVQFLQKDGKSSYRDAILRSNPHLTEAKFAEKFEKFVKGDANAVKVMLPSKDGSAQKLHYQTNWFLDGLAFFTRLL